MATGVRPWSHLVERLSKRASDLQDLIHYPRSASHYEHDDDIHEKLELLMKRVDELEDSLSHVKSRLKLTSEDVFDYVDDAIDTVKCSIRKREKRWNEHEGRVRSVEQSIAALASSGSGTASGKKKGRLMMMPMITTTAVQSIFSQILPKWLRSPPPGSEGAEDQSRPGSHRGAKPTMRGPATKNRLATIAEENNDWGYTWLMESSQLTRVFHAFTSMIFAPLRAVIRMFFGR
ncbi:hypothetical protein P691DRAFT_802122 [Macrolepiota fuliginosa MF-IS2]|uniref:Uncharacterized protein n=1 Tax=Macrolepiota fuliginosa MF-IS2 TaxID=1400762 RepID=A0A9P6C0R3_9AGAR|nr:hypothetical protein P691DRAFT_802122 [Macrolepiota fuliginosa MF-IS2]